jgi:uncharacterized membrane protein YfcA
MNKPPPKVPPRLDEIGKPRPKNKLTGAGILLALATVGTTIAAAVFSPFWLYPRILPSGHYPRLLLAMPIVLCGVVVAAIGSWICKKLGIPVTEEIKDDSDAV